jgi:hypothetical protein
MSGGAVTVPILVGVTGHRDILPAAEPLIREVAARVLETLRREFGDALHVVTALAEGADLLAADIAAKLGIPLVAVSPMPLGRYRATLSTEAARAALDRLWNDPGTALRFELPLMKEGTDEAQYEQLGLLLSRQSHLLLALWDGSNAGPGQPRARGGSAHVVAMRRWGERDEVAPEALWGSALFSGRPPLLELARSGPILHLVTPRARDGGAMCQDADGAPRPPGALLWWSDLHGPAAHGGRAGVLGALGRAVWPAYEHVDKAPSPGWAPVEAEGLPGRLPAQLRQVAALGPELRSYLSEAGAAALHREHEGYLCPEAADRGEDWTLEHVPAAARPALLWLRRLQAVLDVNAAAYQARIMGVWSPGLPWRKDVRLRTLGALFWFALAVPAVALCFELYSHFGKNRWVLLLYCLCIIVPLACYGLLVRRNKWQERFQDRRALAEALRVQFFWAAAGVPVAVSDNYLAQQADALGWIRLALRGPALWGVAGALAAGGPNAGLVRRRWLDDQGDYFVGKQDKARQNERAAVRMERGVGVAAAALVIVGLALLALSLADEELLKHLEPDWLGDVPILVLGLLPASAAFFVIVAEGRAYEAQAHAYSRAGAVFHRAADRAKALGPDDRQGWRELVLAVGREALAENAAWLEAHRQRPVASKAG